jgi:signal transduction histidine kinase
MNAHVKDKSFTWLKKVVIILLIGLFSITQIYLCLSPQRLSNKKYTIFNPDDYTIDERKSEYFYLWSEKKTEGLLPVRLLDERVIEASGKKSVCILHGATDQYCGVGIKFNQVNLSLDDVLLFSMRSVKEVSVQISAQEVSTNTKNPAEDWVYSFTLEPDLWTSIEVPLSAFVLNSFYQPDGQAGNQQFDVDTITQFSFVFPPSPEFSYQISEISIKKSTPSFLVYILSITLILWFALLMLRVNSKYTSRMLSGIAKFAVYLVIVFLSVFFEAKSTMPLDTKFITLIILSVLAIFEEVIFYQSRTATANTRKIASCISPWLVAMVVYFTQGWCPFFYLIFAAHSFSLIKHVENGFWLSFVFQIMVGVVYQSHLLFFLVSMIMLLGFTIFIVYEKRFREIQILKELEAHHKNLKKEKDTLADYLRSAIDNMMDGFVLVNPVFDENHRVRDFELVDMNPAAEKILKKKKVELLNQRLFSLFPIAMDTHLVKSMRDVAMTGRPQNLDCYKPNTEVFDVICDIVIYPVGDAIAVLFRDITERVQFQEERSRLQSQLHLAKKLKGMGLMAGGLSHEFNNILMAIIGHLSLAMNQTADKALINRLEVIEKSANRAVYLTKQLLAFSGKGSFFIEKIDLSQFVDEAKPTLFFSYQDTVDFQFELEENLPLISGDVTQLQQLLVNLVANSCESMSTDNRLVIRTGITILNSEGVYFPQLGYILRNGTYVYLEVEDFGCGMDKKTAAQMFDPFFSTKFIGRGMGLSAVLGIVRGHKGSIHVDSREKEGTRIRIIFPISSGKDKSPEPIIVEDDSMDVFQHG